MGGDQKFSVQLSKGKMGDKLCDGVGLVVGFLSLDEGNENLNQATGIIEVVETTG